MLGIEEPLSLPVDSEEARPGHGTSAATFIVGDPRSGTSLLRSLLDGHPELLVLPFESHLFDWVGAADPVSAVFERTRLWETFERHRGGGRADVEAELGRAFAGAEGARARLLALVDGWARLVGAGGHARWVEKTPRHIYELPTLLDWFPDARVIALRRDPRDIIASELRQRPRSLLGLVVARRLAWQMLRDREGDRRVHVVRYEDLVADPGRVMRGVCAFLSVGWDERSADPTVMGRPFRGNSRFDREISGVSRSPVGRHRDALRDGQRRTVEALLGPILASGGYPVADREAPDGRGRAAASAPSLALGRFTLELIARSGVWRVRALRSAFRT